MPDAPLVSVIIPTYNRADLLPRAAKSVLEQTHRPLELVILNDGSKDDTPRVMEALRPQAEAAGVKTTFVTQENAGLGKAREAGVEASSGRWFGWLDDDDVYYPEKIAKQVTKLQETGADVCCCRLLRTMADGEEPHPRGELLDGDDPADYVTGARYAHINSMLIPRAMFRDVGEFDPELKLSQDVEWCARLAHLARFCAVDEILGTWEHNPKASTNVKDVESFLRIDHYRELVCWKIRERNNQRPNWNQAAWVKRMESAFDQFVKHLLYAGKVREADALLRKVVDAIGTTPKLRRTKRKLRKAKWLALFGKRLKHPKLGDLETAWSNA